MAAVPCDGGFRCHCPRGHAPAVMRISFRPADGTAACLRLLCTGCAETMEAALGSRGAIMRDRLDAGSGEIGTHVKIIGAGKSTKALVSDDVKVTACGVINGVWWCECRPGWLMLHAHPRDVCSHLHALGMTPRTSVVRMPEVADSIRWTAAELLAVGQCAPQCLLALGNAPCSCSCRGRWHGALRAAVARPSGLDAIPDGGRAA